MEKLSVASIIDLIVTVNFPIISSFLIVVKFIPRKLIQVLQLLLLLLLLLLLI